MEHALRRLLVACMVTVGTFGLVALLPARAHAATEIIGTKIAKGSEVKDDYIVRWPAPSDDLVNRSLSTHCTGLFGCSLVSEDGAWRLFVSADMGFALSTEKHARAARWVNFRYTGGYPQEARINAKAAWQGWRSVTGAGGTAGFDGVVQVVDLTDGKAVVGHDYFHQASCSNAVSRSITAIVCWQEDAGTADVYIPVRLVPEHKYQLQFQASAWVNVKGVSTGITSRFPVRNPVSFPGSPDFTNPPVGEACGVELTDVKLIVPPDFHTALAQVQSDLAKVQRDVAELRAGLAAAKGISGWQQVMLDAPTPIESVASGTSTFVSIFCPGGKVVLSGSIIETRSDGTTILGTPDLEGGRLGVVTSGVLNSGGATGWAFVVQNPGGATKYFIPSVICANAAP